MNAIRLFLLLTVAALASGCASTHANNPDDPLEPFNRSMYQFNDAVDKAILKPVAQGYDTVMPDVGKTGVSNFFSNLDDIIVTANDFLQLKVVQGILDGTRFLVNSTVGIYGLIDIGSHIGLEKHHEDFGQTLGKWGIGSGPYVVLPILGPSSVRDGVGLYADSRPDKLRRIEHMRTRNQMYAAKTVSRRADLLDKEEILDEAAIDRYDFIRDTYLLRRQSLVHDGHPPREDEGENNGNSRSPAPTTGASAQPEEVPATGSSAQAAATVAPQPEASRASVYKVWVAQRSGY